MKDLKLRINLPPRSFEVDDIDSILCQVIDEFKWIKPTKISEERPARKLIGKKYDDYREIVMREYLKDNYFVLLDGKNYIMMSPYSNECKGYITYYMTRTENPIAKPGFSEQVKTVMKLVGSPSAHASSNDMYNALIRIDMLQPEGYTASVVVSNDYSEGLLSPFWKLWLNEPYIEFIGKDKLQNAPVVESNFENDIYYAQIFDSPFDWDKPEAVRAIKNFSDFVGSDLFFDRNNLGKKPRAPKFI